MQFNLVYKWIIQAPFEWIIMAVKQKVLLIPILTLALTTQIVSQLFAMNDDSAAGGGSGAATILTRDPKISALTTQEMQDITFLVQLTIRCEANSSGDGGAAAGVSQENHRTELPYERVFIEIFTGINRKFVEYAAVWMRVSYREKELGAAGRGPERDPSLLEALYNFAEQWMTWPECYHTTPDVKGALKSIYKKVDEAGIPLPFTNLARLRLIEIALKEKKDDEAISASLKKAGNRGLHLLEKYYPESLASRAKRQLNEVNKLFEKQQSKSMSKPGKWLVKGGKQLVDEPFVRDLYDVIEKDKYTQRTKGGPLSKVLEQIKQREFEAMVCTALAEDELTDEMEAKAEAEATRHPGDANYERAAALAKRITEIILRKDDKLSKGIIRCVPFAELIPLPYDETARRVSQMATPIIQEALATQEQELNALTLEPGGAEAVAAYRKEYNSWLGLDEDGNPISGPVDGSGAFAAAVSAGGAETASSGAKNKRKASSQLEEPKTKKAKHDVGGGAASAK